MQRPTGITILAVLAIIGGLLGLCWSLTLFGVGGLGIGTRTGGLGLAFGGLGLVSAILYLAFGFGAWTLKPWAWVLGIVGVAVAILSTVAGLIFRANGLIGAILSLIVPVIILWYLLRPEIKQAFGRA